MSPARAGAVCMLVLAQACVVPSDAPAWAVADIHLQPGGDASVHGHVDWQLHDARWTAHSADSTRLCSAMATLQGTRDDSCPQCDVSWTVSVQPDSTDCPTDVWTDHPLLTAITGIGTGPLPDDAEAPSEALLGTWIRYDGEWLHHGWATSADVHVKTWPAGQDLDLHAAWTWPL